MSNENQVNKPVAQPSAVRVIVAFSKLCLLAASIGLMIGILAGSVVRSYQWVLTW